MKKLFMVVALSLGLAGAAGLAAPRLQAEPQEFEFGRVIEGIMVQATFTLTNVGDEPLVFAQKVHTSCGCTSACCSCCCGPCRGRRRSSQSQV